MAYERKTKRCPSERLRCCRCTLVQCLPQAVNCEHRVVVDRCGAECNIKKKMSDRNSLKGGHFIRGQEVGSRGGVWREAVLRGTCGGQSQASTLRHTSLPINQHPG